MSDERRENMQVEEEENEEDREIAELKRQLASTDSELQQSKELQKTLEGAASGSGATTTGPKDAAGASADGAVPIEGEDAEAKEEVDSRSVYVGNVDHSATPEEIQQHFQACGPINRITILCDKFTGHPKGYAYVEFAEATSVTNAMVLNESLFRGRQLSVTAKRTNKPAWARGVPPRGRGRGGYRGGYRGGGGYNPYRGRGRGRGRGHY